MPALLDTLSLRRSCAAVALLAALAGGSPLALPETVHGGEPAVLAPEAIRTRALLAGGGPSPDHNQIAIESNVRYLLRLLPSTTERTVLFADGDRQKETILYEATEKSLKPAEKLLALLLQEREDAHPANLKYRKPSLTQIDGPIKRDALTSAFDRLASGPADRSPILLYFTGHGSANKSRNLDNNTYDLWDEGALSVRDLAAEVARLPAGQSVTLVMVQCYSGSFANLLFRNGDPSQPLDDRDLVGFFATIKERMAAGCTPEVDEAEYRDFTSYFFAALSGVDRVGRKVTGADFDRNGRVTMDEAYCYTLVNNASIDVPVCTSDIFLRKVVQTPDEKVFVTPYAEALRWSSPAQRAALEQLSAKLGLAGDDRAARVYEQMFGPQRRRAGPLSASVRSFLQAREEGRRLLFSRWPDLRNPMESGFAAARKEAEGSLQKWIDDGKFKAILEADDALAVAEEAAYKQEIEDARLLRFVRLYKSVVLAHQLRGSDDKAMIQRFDKLAAAEARTPDFLDRTTALSAR